jgi:hypothetical protein
MKGEWNRQDAKDAKVLWPGCVQDSGRQRMVGQGSSSFVKLRKALESLKRSEAGRAIMGSGGRTTQIKRIKVNQGCLFYMTENLRTIPQWRDRGTCVRPPDAGPATTAWASAPGGGACRTGQQPSIPIVSHQFPDFLDLKNMRHELQEAGLAGGASRTGRRRPAFP